MLVTFSCPNYANITMFGDIAIRLIRMMGHSGTVPSALLAKDVQPALDRLKSAIKANQQQTPEAEPTEDEERDEPAVSLSNRALPLIELLGAAAKADCDVMWDDNS